MICQIHLASLGGGTMLTLKVHLDVELEDRNILSSVLKWSACASKQVLPAVVILNIGFLWNMHYTVQNHIWDTKLLLQFNKEDLPGKILRGNLTPKRPTLPNIHNSDIFQPSEYIFAGTDSFRTLRGALLQYEQEERLQRAKPVSVYSWAPGYCLKGKISEPILQIQANVAVRHKNKPYESWLSGGNVKSVFMSILHLSWAFRSHNSHIAEYKGLKLRENTQICIIQYNKCDREVWNCISTLSTESEIEKCSCMCIDH